MPQLSKTHKRSIVDAIKKIEDSDFDTDTIMLLLINIRDLIDDSKSFIKELAHFIAHPERDRGACYECLSLNALSVKRAVANGILATPIEFASIRKDLFELISIGGIKRWKREYFLDKKPGAGESEIRTILQNSYEYDNKKRVYTIKNISQLQALFKIMNECLGFASANPLVNDTQLTTELNNSVKDIFKKYIPDNKYKDSILNKADDIMVCIFGLFQDSQFKLADGSEGGFSLSYEVKAKAEAEVLAYNELGFTNTDALIRHMRIDEIKESSIELLGNFGLRTNIMATSFISSGIRLGNYIDDNYIEEYLNAPKVSDEPFEGFSKHPIY